MLLFSRCHGETTVKSLNTPKNKFKTDIYKVDTMRLISQNKKQNSTESSNR